MKKWVSGIFVAFLADLLFETAVWRKSKTVYWELVIRGAPEEPAGTGGRAMVRFPSIDMVATGKNISRMREKAGFSVKDLQSLFGFATPQAIYKWQRGAAVPTIDNLLVLATLFEVHIEEIVVIDGDLTIPISEWKLSMGVETEEESD